MAYRRAHGYSNHEKVFEQDFINWISERWLEFEKIYPEYRVGKWLYTDVGHRAFNAWLVGRYLSGDDLFVGYNKTMKYRLMREEDGKYVVDMETDSLEEMYRWMKPMIDFMKRKGWT